MLKVVKFSVAYSNVSLIVVSYNYCCAEYYYVQCCIFCSYPECRYTEYRKFIAMLSVVMFSFEYLIVALSFVMQSVASFIAMLSAVMSSVVVLSVVASFPRLSLNGKINRS
jgi:hypothetical protein